MDDVVKVHDFTVISTRTTSLSKSGHYLFAKKIDTSVLLVLNIPPYVNESCLVAVFSGCGKVKRIEISSTTDTTTVPEPLLYCKYFDATPHTSEFKIARIHFTKESSVDNAVNLSFNKPLLLSTQENPICSGVEKWLKEYKEANTCDIQSLKKHVDQYMEKYDAHTKRKVAAEKAAASQPDEDGWTLVTRQGRNKGAPRTQTTEHSVADKYKLKLKHKELLNFYAFQKTNAKREHIAELRQKFEEDKQKISQMKSQRRFRPY